MESLSDQLHDNLLLNNNVELVPCADGYHLQHCEHMFCVNSFKCLHSYCLIWGYTCNGKCDCPYCEDESICQNVSCPGMKLIESSPDLLSCRTHTYTWTSTVSALIMNGSDYDLYKAHQQANCDRFAYAVYCPSNAAEKYNERILLNVEINHG